jgi:uncharacterized membrane protein YqiK
MSALIVAAATAFLLLGAILLLFKLLHRRAAPDEILVVSGPPSPRFESSHLQLPMLELVDRLELRAIEVDLTLLEAEERAGGKLRARVLVARESEGLARAARLLLDLSRAERERIVERVLEAAAVGVLGAIGRLAMKDPELESIARQVSEEAAHELASLGLQLDGLRFALT